jgi:spore photoproduct lyase
MNQRLNNILREQFKLKANTNQLREIECLIFEIMKREDISQKTILSQLPIEAAFAKKKAKEKFIYIKNALIKRRFPLAAAENKLSPDKVFISQVPLPLEDNYAVRKTFIPEIIYVEEDAENTPLLHNFEKYFPQTPVKKIKKTSDYLKENPFVLSDLKKPLVFLVHQKWDMIKPCPCTKNHYNCGYWIFNLGFGCPFDCSYCFLQHYSNFPGILLPANIADFFKKFESLEKRLTKKIRIGTGEFCDSLALDHVTRYSEQLIPYFSQKNVLFELKTKSDNIGNILKIRSSPNIIISWSLNPSTLVDSEEQGAATLEERFIAAQKVQKAGYRVAFHFDPIIACQDWRPLYENLINQLYERLKPPFAWISLGTLRCHRSLKAISQKRFPQSMIFYGELLLAKDKKLRYSSALRQNIYREIYRSIIKHDEKTPIYLCMEDKVNWNVLNKNCSNNSIERHLVGD